MTCSLIVLAALTRVVAALLLGDRFYFFDEAIYADAARALLAGRGFGPGYANVPAQPVLLAALSVPWPERLVLLRCAHAVLTGALGGVVVRALGERIAGAAVARVALVLWAFDPLVVVAGGLLYPDAVAGVVLAGALVFALAAAAEDRLPSTIIAGVLLGVLVLFRPVATLLAPVVASWIGATVEAPLTRRLRHAVVALVACGGIVAPWVLHNVYRGGQVVPVGMAGVQAAPVPKSDVHRDGLVTTLGRTLWQEPTRITSRVAHELLRFWELYPTRLQTDDPAERASMHQADARLPSDDAFPRGPRDVASAVSFGGELACALGGIVVGWRRRRAAVVLLVAVAFVYGLGYAVFVAKLRYRIAVLPCVFVLAGIGASALLDGLRGVVRRDNVPEPAARRAS